MPCQYDEHLWNLEATAAHNLSGEHKEDKKGYLAFFYVRQTSPEGESHIVKQPH